MLDMFMIVHALNLKQIFCSETSELRSNPTCSFYSWIFEDFNGNNDGIMAGPLTFYVPWIAEFCFNKDSSVRSWQSTETYGVVE